MSHILRRSLEPFRPEVISAQWTSRFLPMPSSDKHLAVAVDAALAAGKLIAAAWGRPMTVEHKGAVDLVTETDKQCEELIHARLSQAFPSHRYQQYSTQGADLDGAACRLRDTSFIGSSSHL